MSAANLTRREKFILAEVEGWEDWKQAFFHDMVGKGQTIVFAHMAASQEAPRGMTDSVMMSGQIRLSQMPDDERDKICKAAVKRGYNPKPSDAYMPGMSANGTGDPDAFFNNGEGLSKIREVCKKRRVNSDGVISVKGYTEPEEDPHNKGPRLHPRLVNRHLNREIAKNPDLARKDLGEVKHNIIEKHGRKKK